MSGTTPRTTPARRVLHRLVVAAGAIVLTLAFFLVLPVIQAITAPPDDDSLLRGMDVVEAPPPPDVIEEEPEEEEPEEEEPPELEPELEPLDLSELELALNPGGLGGVGGPSLGLELGQLGGGGESMEEVFSMADLDQQPRAIYQVQPTLDARIRRKGAGTVWILFEVDERGRVEDAVVQSSPDPVFERPALAAVKKWKFEPGKRKGKPVAFRMRVPISFPG